MTQRGCGTGRRSRTRHETFCEAIARGPLPQAQSSVPSCQGAGPPGRTMANREPLADVPELAKGCCQGDRGSTLRSSSARRGARPSARYVSRRAVVRPGPTEQSRTPLRPTSSAADKIRTFLRCGFSGGGLPRLTWLRPTRWREPSRNISDRAGVAPRQRGPLCSDAPLYFPPRGQSGRHRRSRFRAGGGSGR